MLWFPLSLTCALSVAVVDLLSKKAMGTTTPYVVAWVRLGYCIPFLAVSLIWIRIPPLDATFFGILLVMLPLEIAALLLYTHAIHESPLSLTVPFLALTPVFLIVTARLILGEEPDTSGMAGILLIALGAYLLHIDKRKKGWLEPIRAVAREPGSRKMIVVAFLYSITAALGKAAIFHSSAPFFGVTYFPLLALLSFPFLGLRGKETYRALLSRKKLFLVIGLVQTIMIFTHVTAIRLVEVPYMVSIKRTSLLFAILFGGIFFREELIQQRLTGGLCMVAGVVLILL